MNKIPCIIGPTAIGKSTYAIKLAQELNGEIISADAFQVYQEFDIGTAKVSKESQKEVPHHLIDIKDAAQTYSVSEFVTLCNQKINEIISRGKTPIICGGTGFYVHSFLYGYTFIEEEDPELLIRQQYKKQALENGIESLWQDLFLIDPETANNLAKTDQKRIIRALEVYTLTQKPPSKSKGKTETPRADVDLILLTAERELIYQRIEKRVDQMVEEGLIEEVDYLRKKYPIDAQAFQGLGYKQTIDFLDGKISKEMVIDLIKTKTRQFAKKQLTWFRKYENAKIIKIS